VSTHSIHTNDYFDYDLSCIYNISKEYRESYTSGVSGSIDTTSWMYDSLCRPIKSVVTGFYNNNGSGTLLPGDSSETDYIYLDCNHLMILGIDTLINCLGQTDTIYYPFLFVYGGSGSYTYSWTPTGLLSNDTILNPIFLSDSNIVYVLTVHDSLGNSSTHQLTSVINNFTTVATDASCYSCNDGSVNIVFPVPISKTYLSITPYAGTTNGSSITGLPVGDYLVCSVKNQFCKTCDSIHISSPNGIQMLENKYINIFPNPAQKDFFVRIDPPFFHSSVSWLLRDLQGREIKKNTETNSQFKVDVSEISNGVYYFEVSIADNPSTKFSARPELFQSVKKIVIFRSFQ
jgi:hypothetical protein